MMSTLNTLILCLALTSADAAPMETQAAPGKAHKKSKAVPQEVSPMSLEIKSPAFAADGRIPKKHTCDGRDVSPRLSWSGAPKDTKSFALIMDDPDAPPGTWVHWVLYDLPAIATELEEGIPKKETLPSGAKQGLCWGVDDFDRVGYYGPCPPPGSPHRYFFKLYALDKVLGLQPGATKPQLLKAMEGRILGQAELVGLYKR